MWERGHLKLGKEGVKLLSKCEAAVRGWVALAFDVGLGCLSTPGGGSHLPRSTLPSLTCFLMLALAVLYRELSISLKAEFQVLFRP